MFQYTYCINEKNIYTLFMVIKYDMFSNLHCISIQMYYYCTYFKVSQQFYIKNGKLKFNIRYIL